MNASAIAFVATLPFVVTTLVICRVLQRKVTLKEMPPAYATLIIWLTALCLPWLLTWLWVPIANYIFTTFPSLQSPAWDVGLAFSLNLGMLVSYFFGVLAASIISWQFLGRATQRRSDGAT